MPIRAMIPLSNTNHSWMGMANDANGNVYACNMSGSVWCCLAGASVFTQLNITGLPFVGVDYAFTVAANGTIYLVDWWSGVVYTVPPGGGAATGLESQDCWHRMGSAPNGDVYATYWTRNEHSGGGVRKRAGGTGVFADMNVAYKRWTGISANANGDLYACVADWQDFDFGVEPDEVGDIYKFNSGSGEFESIGQGAGPWTRLCSDGEGNMYCFGPGYSIIGGGGGYIWKKTQSQSKFYPIDTRVRDGLAGLTVSKTTGVIFNAAGYGDLRMEIWVNPPAAPRLGLATAGQRKNTVQWTWP